ncbi:c-type cytochrome [Magnetococcales bacterium HHB-1]
MRPWCLWIIIGFILVDIAQADDLSPLPVQHTLEPPLIGIPEHVKLKQVYHIKKRQFFKPPSVWDIPENARGKQIAYGRNLFINTQKYGKRYVGNGLNCSNCHLSEGRQPKAAPLWAAYGKYPMVKEKTNQVVTLKEQMQKCFRTGLNGIAPTLDSKEMNALIAYASWLATDIPINEDLPGRGLAYIKRSKDPLPMHGRTLYQVNCQFCHGKDGQGQKHPQNGSYMFPPVWGSHSYNKANGFGKVKTLAKFIRGNMPLGKHDHLTMDESLSVAVYLWLQNRPYDPSKSYLINSMFPPGDGQN